MLFLTCTGSQFSAIYVSVSMVASIVLFAPQMAAQQHVNHSLSSSFHVITCGMQLLFLPEQAFDISRMKSHSTVPYNMQH